MDKDSTLQKYKEITPIDEKHGVFLVENQDDHCIYTKKRLKYFDADVLEFFKNERFPHIPRLIETVRDGEEMVIIEEHINGRTLDDMLKEGLFSERETVETVLQLCDILRPLHRHQPAIIHRDIKPSNLIMKDGVLYLIDFDIAKDYEPGKSRDTELMGTAGYAAPEQYGFGQSTPRTDIYSVGVLMNKMLTGNLPSEEHYEGPLSGVIGRCTAIEPGRRYATVDELAAALTEKRSSRAIPGFRAGKPLYAVLAVMWYAFCAAVVASYNADGEGVPYEGFALVVNKAGLAAALIGLTIYVTNYLGVRDIFPFRKTTNILIEAVRLAAGAAILIVAPVFVVVIIEQFL